MIKRKEKHENIHPGDKYVGIEHDSDTAAFNGPDDTADKDHDGVLDGKPGLGKDKA